MPFQLDRLHLVPAGGALHRPEGTAELEVYVQSTGREQRHVGGGDGIAVALFLAAAVAFAAPITVAPGWARYKTSLAVGALVVGQVLNAQTKKHKSP